MTYQSVVSGLIQLVLMLAVVAAYVTLARRHRLLWHPLAIVVAVGIVSIVVAVVGELVFRGGWAAVPAMARRSAVGGFGWGAIIAGVVWIGRRVSVARRF